MKIIIASTIVPFINGGGRFISDWLKIKLREYGHTVDEVNIPYSSHYKYMLPQMIGLRLYHLEDACDRLVCIRMPSYLLRHPQKYLWFIHHYREIYDIWNTDLDTFPKTYETYAIREHIMRADDNAFKEARKIYTNSQIVSKRLLEFNGIPSIPVYPPLLKPEQFHCDSYGDFLYYSSRICSPKRQLLAVEAMKYTKTNVRLVITGRVEQPDYFARMIKMIKDEHLESKVTLLDEWITEEQKAKYYAQCLAALYIPFDEDSYGYPSLEAHHSEKSVISCKDSGGTDEIIVDGKNGFLLDPDPQTLASHFDMLYEDRKKAETMGRAGLERLNELEITWDNVIRRFTE